MARLGSQAKAGFYPTPDCVCRQLQQLLAIDKDARLLDPCCGEGKTLSALAAGRGTTYGIELDHERATDRSTRSTRWRSSLWFAKAVCSKTS